MKIIAIAVHVTRVRLFDTFPVSLSGASFASAQRCDPWYYVGSISYLSGTAHPREPTGGLTTTTRQWRKLVGMRPTDRKKLLAIESVRTGVATADWKAEEASTQRPAAAQAIDLVKTYGVGQAEVHALAGVSVRFEKAQFTAVMGPSGSGKSTLMHCMAGLDASTSGHAYVGEQDVAQLDDAGLTELRRDHIGFIFQSFNLIPTLTARENVVLPADLAGTKVDGAWFDHLVGQLRIGDRLSHRPTEMSGGQQQRVACARALVGRPDLVFADEPTGNLDSNASAEMLGFLRQSVGEFGQSIVMVTHDAHSAAYADRVVFLADGQVVGDVADPTADSVLEQMKQLGS
jgi:putative ABC transport system ATP-binding protein